MSVALYRKWRPKTFDDVYGQEHITSVLRYEAEKGNFNHAYLFCGSRGTGKTTCAKILAKVANCEHPVNGNPCGQCAACRAIEEGSAPDILEMDAASNNSVDNIRDIRDEVVYPPSMLKYRVYIVDEVHMLSDSAFNALLKTLEEPPSYVIFILATTELHELPATIISRCQRFEFRRIAVDTLVSRLTSIAREEKINVSRGALQIIAKQAQGGMRDAISLLELCAGGRRDREITEEDVNETVGISGRDTLCRVVEGIAAKNFEAVFEEVDKVVQSSKDITVFWQNLLSFYRDMLVMKTAQDATKYLDLTDNETAQMEKVTALFTRETILSHCKQLENALYAISKSNAVKRIVAEMTLVRMCDETLDTSTEALLSRISKLEEAVVLGKTVTPAPTAEPKEDKTETVRKDPTVQPAKKQTPAAPSAPSAAPAAEKKVLRYLSCWAEVLERISQTNPSEASYLRQTKAYSNENGRVGILVPDPFTMMMVDKPSVKKDVRAAIALCTGRELAEDGIYFEESPRLPEDDGDLILDELFKNLQ